MKKVLLTVICFAMVLFWANGLQADAIDGIFQFFKAGETPEIDGLMDDVWKSASTERMNKVCGEDVEGQPESYNDLNAWVRAMWDEENIYLFFRSVDDVLVSTDDAAHENDSFEFYFDGDNSKTAGQYDGIDDIQFRIRCSDVYSEAHTWDYNTSTTWTWDSEGASFGISQWEYEDLEPCGWDLEVKIPVANVYIDGEVGALFGFETQLNENDDGSTRENMLRWWGTSNEGWHDASYFGTAELSDYVASSTLQIVKASSAPTIDGEIAGDDAWIAPWIDQSTYVLRNGDTYPDGYAELDDSTDFYMRFKVMWDADNMYLFVEVTDETVFCDTTGTTHEQDGVEVYFDGDNSKKVGPGYDDVDDKQYRWIYGKKAVAAGAADGGTWAWKETEVGYDLEVQIPKDMLLFDPEDGAVIGFEVQVNDNDGQSSPARENMARWWSDDNMSWNDASLFGTAELVSGVNAIDSKPVTKARHFELSQNYPNPFNASTSISYTIERSGMVKLTVFDMVGKEVAKLVNEFRNPGDYKVTFDGSNLSTGIYFYRLETGSNVATQKMMLLK
jgi:hypothetical protein